MFPSPNTSNALSKIFHYTHGVPRLVNGLCDRALLTGYVNEVTTITTEIIDEVAGELPALINEPKDVLQREELPA